MAITKGTSIFAPVDFGITEALFGDTSNPNQVYAQSQSDGGLNYNNPINTALQQDRSSSQNQSSSYPNFSSALQNQYYQNNPPQSSVSNPQAQGYQSPQSTEQSGAAQGDTRLTQLEKIGSSRNPKQEEEYTNLINSIRPDESAINSVFDPAFASINQFESNLRGQLPGLISEAESQAQASRQLLDNQRTNTNELLGSQLDQTEQQRLRGVGQQRQTLQELQQANQARFGGASSAGQAASELQGREFQRGTAGINQQAQQAVQQIQQQKQQVNRDYNQGLQQLKVNTDKAVNDIRRRFDDKLAEINSERNRVESEKAMARQQALSEFRNAAFQINLQKAQFEQDLRSQAQQNTSYLDNVAQQYMGYGQAGQGALDQAGAYQPTQINGVSGQGTSQQQSLTGSFRPEDLYGSIAGSSEIDPRFQGFNPRQSFAR